MEQFAKIDLNILNVMTTTRCTLKCKDCTSYYYEFTSQVDVDIERIAKSLDRVFQIIGFVGELRVSGAEVFLYPHFISLLKLLDNYKNCFNHILIITNGTYVPNMQIIDALEQLSYNYSIRVDDYGKLSAKLNQVKEIFDSRCIKYEVRHYNDEEQFMGGWVDLGHCEFKGYTQDELVKVFNRCQSRINCALIWDNRYYGCGPLSTWVKLGKIPDAKSDYVDLDSIEPLSALREKIETLNLKPFEGCRYCNGFDPENSPRVKAAEQI